MSSPRLLLPSVSYFISCHSTGCSFEALIDTTVSTVLLLCNHCSSTGAAVAQIVNETIPALQKLKEEGLVKFIGITGYPLDIYTYVLDR